MLLAACASTPPAAPPALPPVVSGDGFALEGRISVSHGSQSLSGKIGWAHEAARDEIGLASPLGNQLARLVRNDAGVTLTDGEQKTTRAPDAETLTEQTLGWRLPLAGLVEWVRGRPSAGVPDQVRRDAQGRLEYLAQSDWRIDYAYDDSGAAPARLPRRLLMRYVKAAEPLEIRIVIDQWSTP